MEEQTKGGQDNQIPKRSANANGTAMVHMRLLRTLKWDSSALMRGYDKQPMLAT